MKGMGLGYIIMTNGRRSSSSLGDGAGCMCRGGGFLGGDGGLYMRALSLLRMNCGVKQVNAKSTRESREGECIVNFETINLTSVKNSLCFYLYRCLGVFTV